MSFPPAGSAYPWLLAVCLAPLLPGIINRTKAAFAGRRGPPLLQGYFDLVKLLRKGAVYSETTTWVFRAGPPVAVGCGLIAAALVPGAGAPALAAFQGDAILLAVLFGTARFMTMLAALDTGSSFEGMGASREAAFSAAAEPVLLLGVAAITRGTGQLSLTRAYEAIGSGGLVIGGPAIVLVIAALMAVILVENSRIPVDDPNTHLELTMIHEVMVLDHGGPDLGLIQYAGALKLWVLGAMLSGLVLPIRGNGVIENTALFLGTMGALAVVIGVIESSMARLRLVRVPRLLVGAGACAALAYLLVR